MNARSPIHPTARMIGLLDLLVEYLTCFSERATVRIS
jgi:hypothetical protein